MRAIASCSACVTQAPYLCLTATCVATYAQRNALLGGSQVAASPSPLARFALASTESRFSGSLANWTRRSSGQDCAPFCHASPSATTWSMSTSLAPPRTKATGCAVYGSSSRPDRTTQSPAYALWVRSRRRTRSRVSQPPTLDHPSPNRSRSYPVRGARPLTGRVSSASSAREGGGATVTVPPPSPACAHAKPAPSARTRMVRTARSTAEHSRNGPGQRSDQGRLTRCVYRYTRPRMAERVTLQTIADAVGVGKMTVSNAYSRPRHVSAELRQRIFKVAEELGYGGPDAAGRALARRRTGLVGVLLTSSPDEAFENLVALGFVSAIARALTPRALSLALLSGEQRDDLVPATDIAMDGLIVYSCLADDEASRTLMRRGLPMVLVDQPPRPGISSVNIEDEKGAALAAQHVVELGHREVGIVVPWLDAPDGVTGFDPGRLQPGKLRSRLEGWCGTLARAGVAY